MSTTEVTLTSFTYELMETNTLVLIYPSKYSKLSGKSHNSFGSLLIGIKKQMIPHMKALMIIRFKIGCATPFKLIKHHLTVS